MAMPTISSINGVKIAQFANALYGVVVGKTTNGAVLADIASYGADSVFNAYYNYSFGSQTDATVAATVVANLGITGASATQAQAAVAAALTGAAPGAKGAALSSLLTSFSGMTSDATYGAAATAWNTAIANAVAYTNSGATADYAISAGAVYDLGTGMDNMTGGSGADVFQARIIDNANTLQSGDVLDGGTGADTLYADIGDSQRFAITAQTSNIETVQVRVQANQSDSGDNNIASVGIVDAQRMSGVNRWESNNSRADLVIEDVRIGATQITKDITIAMVSTDPGQVDFGVYFDQHSLRNISTSTSQLNLQVIDTSSTLAGTAPLLSSPYSGFVFYANGTKVTLDSQAINDAQTYAELRTAFENAVNAAGYGSTVTVTIGSNFTVADPTTGSSVTGQEIVLTATGAITITTPTGSGWVASGTVPANSGLHTNYTTGASTSTALVTSTIILDDVGRGSTGGDLVVGGLSVGDTSSSKGVQRFDIEVRDNSKLQTINSTNNTLQEVYITNGATDVASSAYVTTTANSGSLTVNGIVAGGDAALPGTTTQHNAYGFSDVKIIDGSAMTGALAFNAEVTTASISKYLNLTDTASPAADNDAFVYSGGSGGDTMNVLIDSTVAASSTLSGREDFTFTVNGNSGNDSITLNIGGSETAAWLVDQRENANVAVNGGAGNDTINTPGAGDIVINAGAGNDTVYSDNSGAKAATWLVSAANLVTTDLQGVPANDTSAFLYKGKLKVTFSADVATGGVTAPAAAPATNGWEVSVDITTGTNYSVNQYYLNQAIKTAINSDAVLSKLLGAADGPMNTLVITSKIDGAFAATDLIMTVSATDVTTYTTTEQAAVLAAYKEFAGNSQATIAAAQTAQAASVTNLNNNEGMNIGQVLALNGTASVAESDDTIDMGAGTDVLVLSTGALSNEKVVFTGYDNGQNTIVNFADSGTSLDGIDFSAYLTNKMSSSGSTASQSTIARTLDANAVADANEVIVLAAAGHAFTATQTFSGLTGTNLLAALNNTNATFDYAGLLNDLDANNGYVQTGAPTTLVGGVGKAVVMVENGGNLGEYKMFELAWDGTATNTTNAFTSATLIGVADFGATINMANVIAGVAAPVAPTVSIAAGAATVAEGASATFTVTLSAAQATATTVAYTLATTGAATAGVDYTVPAPASVTIAAGATTGTFTVAVPNDGVAEAAAEGFSATLTAPAGFALGTAAASVSITDAGAAAGASTVAVAATNGATPNNATVGTVTYNINVASTYAYGITGFAAGDAIAFAAGSAISVTNTSGTDGTLIVAGSLAGQTVTITLTGVAVADDGGVFNAASFNTVFGAGSLA